MMIIIILQEKGGVEMKVETSSARESRAEGRRYSGSGGVIAGKYSAAREQAGRQKPVSPATVSLLEGGRESQEPPAGSLPGPASGIASTWASMKTGLQNFRANMGSKKFLPLSHAPEDAQAPVPSSSASLDEIFQKLKKRPSFHRGVTLDDDEDGGEEDEENDSRAGR